MLTYDNLVNLGLAEAVARRCFVKKVFLEISRNSQENTCTRVSFLIKSQAEACNFIKKQTLAQVFSCEFCKISKNTFYYRTPFVAASAFIKHMFNVEYFQNHTHHYEKKNYQFTLYRTGL